MARYVPTEMRQSVANRAVNRCEYCLIGQVSILRHHVEHIVPLRHGGRTSIENLALSCPACNENKGMCVGSFDFDSDGAMTRFFNPRIDNWSEHFRIENADIVPLTGEARVTLKILRINDEDRVEERNELLMLGLYG